MAVCALILLGLAADGAAAPGAFNKLAPANGATGRSRTPTFSWESSAGAVSYEVCGSLTAVCPSTTAWEPVGNVTSAQWPGPPLDYDTTYYWQVRAVAADGSKTGANGGTWWHFTSQVQAPGAFGKVSPANGAADQATSLTVTWGTSARAASYEYCLDTTNDNSCSGGWTSTGTGTGAVLIGLSRTTTYYWHVRAVNAGGTTYADSNAWWSFATQIEPPAAFSKASPANGATVSGGGTDLSWAASAGATSYEYCIDSTNDSSCSGSWASTGTGTGAVLLGLSYDTAYYWQVRAINSGGTTVANSGTWWSFRTQVEAPAAFNKTSPADGAPSMATSFALTWGASSRATSYEYCYDTTNDGVCAGSWTSAGSSTNGFISGLSYSTTYYWQVRAVNGGGTTGANNGVWWSVTTQGAPPGEFSKSTPFNMGSAPTRNHALTWTASSGATYYEFCSDTTNDNLCSGQWTQTLGATTGANVTSPTNGTTWYWQVRAINANGTTVANGGVWWSYTVQELPGAFAKVAPANGAAAQPTSLTLSWAWSALATSYEYCYDTTGDAACSGNWTYVGAATSAAVSGLAYGTTYYWQVRALNAYGTTGASMDTWWSFTTLVEKPAAFGKIGPANGAENRSTTPTFSWQASAGATGYEVCGNIAATCAGTWTPVGNVTTATWPGAELEPGTTYYWQVRAVNAAGFTPADGAAWWHFTTQPRPGIFGKTGPTDGATGRTTDPTISWQASQDAASYQYCIDTTNDSVCATSWLSAGTATAAALGGLQQGTTYYWQVRAVNAGGTREADNLVWWSFQTAFPPGAFGKVSLRDGAVARPFGQALSAQLSQHATSYEYCLATSPACPGTWTSLGIVPFITLPQLEPGTTYYWQVRAVNVLGSVEADGGAWWRLVVEPAPDGFSKTAPAHGATALSTAVTFRWDRSGNAQEYRYCLAVGRQQCTGSWYRAWDMTEVWLTGLTPGTIYHWQVRAENLTDVIDANNGSWWRFSTALPSWGFTKASPLNGATDVALRPTLSWQPTDGATSYELCVHTSPACPVQDWPNVGNRTSVELPELDPATTYYWQVRAIAGGTRTAANDRTWWQLTTQYDGSGAFDKAAPANGATIDLPFVELTWQPSPGATSYEYCVASTPACPGPWTGVGAETSVVVSNLADNTSYLWQVRAVSPGGKVPANGGSWWRFNRGLRAKDVTTGIYHGCVLKTDGTLFCWGWSQLYGPWTWPVGTSFSQVSAGARHTCGIRAHDSAVVCWGSDAHGQATPPWDLPFKQVSAGWNHTCGVMSTGGVVCWGLDYAGASTPPAGSFTQVDAGQDFTCGLRADGTMACWGYNASGQASPPAGTFVQLSVDSYHGCAVRTDGTIACWGSNRYLQATPPAGTFSMVSVGGNLSCGIRSDGTIVCWGSGSAKTPPAGIFTRLGVAGTFAWAVRDDGTVACWGDHDTVPTVVFSPSTLPATSVGVPYLQTLVVSAATATPHTFRIAEGMLPPGLSLDESTGVLSGEAQVAGRWSFTVRVVDGNFIGVDRDYAIDVGEPTRPRGDFTGDLKSDILWRHASGGDIWLWPMDGAARVSETYVRTIADTTWEIRAVADLDGDGKTDLFWRNKTSGQLYFWQMNGSTPAAEIYVGTVDPAYDIVGTGDFDGDGKSDILWRHTTWGDVWIWLMNGPTRLAQVHVDRVDPGYVVKGVGDLDADGKADIVWHHATTGEVWVWPMNGTTRLNQVWVGTVPDTGYEIQGVADFTGDGQADLLWWHASRGEVWIWTMNGPARVAETWVGTVAETAYRIVGNGDYDGDGKADILWHHATRGEVWVWLMDGTTKLSEHQVGTVPDTGYQIVRVK